MDTNVMEEGTVSIFYPKERESSFSEMLIHMYQTV
jgi:hypothetical protein